MISRITGAGLGYASILSFENAANPPARNTSVPVTMMARADLLLEID
ncbi:MAG: hypothetical protein ACRECU_12335 [Methylocella sp.]